MRQPSVAIYPSMVSVFSYIRISEILRKSLTIIRKFLKKKDPNSIVKVNSGRSIPKAEVTSANPKVEVTLANFTPLAYFML